MNLFEVIALMLTSSVVTAFVNNLFLRGKTNADAASALVKGAVDVVKLKDEVIAEIRAELTSELEAEREKRRALADRVNTLDSEKKIYKFRLQPFKAKMLSLNSKQAYATSTMNGSREKTWS